MTIKVAVVGATGRMGKLAIDLIEGAQDLSLHAALDSKSELSQMLGADVVFDVTNPDVSGEVVAFAINNGLKILVGTSGYSAAKLATLAHQLDAASPTSAAVVVIPNFSVGSMLATRFAVLASEFFDSIEIIEAHHAGKVDSPSGTAVRTAELISEARETAGKSAPLVPGLGQSARGELVAGVPIHSLRVAGVSASQEVVLGGDSELLTISHTTSSVQAYSKGILLALRHTASATGLTVGLDKVIG
jgi:4-hydroxy-tetrahydrodipicolinate reductase